MPRNSWMPAGSSPLVGSSRISSAGSPGGTRRSTLSTATRSPKRLVSPLVSTTYGVLTGALSASGRGFTHSSFGSSTGSQLWTPLGAVRPEEVELQVACRIEEVVAAQVEVEPRAVGVRSAAVESKAVLAFPEGGPVLVERPVPSERVGRRAGRVRDPVRQTGHRIEQVDHERQVEQAREIDRKSVG